MKTKSATHIHLHEFLPRRPSSIHDGLKQQKGLRCISDSLEIVEEGGSNNMCEAWNIYI